MAILLLRQTNIPNSLQETMLWEIYEPSLGTVCDTYTVVHTQYIRPDNYPSLALIHPCPHGPENTLKLLFQDNFC